MGILEILSGQQKLDAMTELPVEEDFCIIFVTFQDILSEKQCLKPF